MGFKNPEILEPILAFKFSDQAGAVQGGSRGGARAHACASKVKRLWDACVHGDCLVLPGGPQVA